MEKILTMFTPTGRVVTGSFTDLVKRAETKSVIRLGVREFEHYRAGVHYLYGCGLFGGDNRFHRVLWDDEPMALGNRWHAFEYFDGGNYGSFFSIGNEFFWIGADGVAKHIGTFTFTKWRAGKLGAYICMDKNFILVDRHGKITLLKEHNYDEWEVGPDGPVLQNGDKFSGINIVGVEVDLGEHPELSDWFAGPSGVFYRRGLEFSALDFMDLLETPMGVYDNTGYMAAPFGICLFNSAARFEENAFQKENMQLVVLNNGHC